MAHIQLEPDPSQNPETQSIFDEIKSKAEVIPAPYRAFGRHTHILQVNWNKTKRVLSEGNLSFQLKESIALAVSAANGCHFCVDIHRGRLGKMDLVKEEIDRIENAQSSDPSLQQVLEFTVQATKDPSVLTEGDFATIASLGYSEEDILEMLTVMEMFTGYNKIIVALGIQIDD